MKSIDIHWLETSISTAIGIFNFSSSNSKLNNCLYHQRRIITRASSILGIIGRKHKFLKRKVKRKSQPVNHFILTTLTLVASLLIPITGLALFYNLEFDFPRYNLGQLKKQHMHRNHQMLTLRPNM